MHDIAPFDKWLHLYDPEEDERSSYFGLVRNEQYTLQVYNYLISPYWDELGSRTLYCKLLYVDYEEEFAIIELVGEWNDTIENDIMHLKRTVIDHLISEGVYKYVLIAENVLNFHSSDESYYEEWQEDIEPEGGFIICLNTPEHTQHEMKDAGLDRYLFFMEYEKWRTHEPLPFFQMLEEQIMKRLS